MKNPLFKEWLKAALIRAVKTIAQTAVGMIAVGAALSDVNWIYVGSVSVTAGILSLLTSVAGLPEVDRLETIDLLGGLVREYQESSLGDNSEIEGKDE